MKQKKKRTIDIQFVTATISTSLVLLLLGAVMLVVLSAQSLSNHVRENLTLSLLLNDEVAQKEVDRIITYVNAQSYTKEIQYISKEAILAEQTESMGLDPTEFLGYNPYTASIEVKLKAAYANSDSIVPIKNRLMRYTQIREISYPSELMDSVNDNIRKISAILLSLALALALISFALINNTIKLTIYSQRFLLHTMKLVGATRSFIRAPFLVQAAFQGVFAAFIAIIALVVMLFFVRSEFQQLFEIFRLDLLLTVIGIVLAAGLAICLTSTWFVVNKLVSLKKDELYY